MPIFIAEKGGIPTLMVALDITRLPAIVHTLTPEKAALFGRIYSYYSETGRLVLPEQMQDWVHEKYGEIERQQIVRVINIRTNESTLYNSVRARRPVITVREDEALALPGSGNGGPFAVPLTETPEDTFGRIHGDHWVTASNIAKYDYLHALIIARDDEPFTTDEARILDLLNVAVRWCQEANRVNPAAVYPFLLWNVLWRAGASVLHCHAQILLTHTPYSAPAWMARVRDDYRRDYGSEYYEDLFAVHTELGLGLTFGGASVMAHLTPKKEHEVVLFAKTPHRLAPALSRVLLCYQRMGIRSFNVALFMPQLEEGDYYVARIVDRGDIAARTSDIGGMELYAGTPIVASDPFRLMEHLSLAMSRGQEG